MSNSSIEAEGLRLKTIDNGDGTFLFGIFTLGGIAMNVNTVNTDTTLGSTNDFVLAAGGRDF
jgi:hypothetical protein